MIHCHPLCVLQLNVARSNGCMHTLLNTLTQFDIVLFQEPWYGQIGIARSSDCPDGTDIMGTVANAAWEAFTPEPDHDVSPLRVTTYVQKGINHLVARPCPDILYSKDIQAISILYGETTFHIINVYNAGPGSIAQHINLLQDTSLDPGVPTAIAGDFNLHHPEWAMQQVPSISSTADNFVDWFQENAYFLQNDKACCTQRGHRGQSDTMIDLTLFNYQAEDMGLFGGWDCREDLAMESDHNAILWTVSPPDDSTTPDISTDPQPNLGFRIDPAHQKEWCEAFETAINARPPPANYTSPDDVERGAEALLAAFATATEESMPHCTHQVVLKAPWWNDDCDLAVADLFDSHTEREEVCTRARAHLLSVIRTAKCDSATDQLQKVTPQDV
jgi:hypothetical protein